MLCPLIVFHVTFYCCCIMEIVDRLGVKVPNVVIVSGLAGLDKDESIVNDLKQYCSIARSLTVDDNTSEFHKSLIVEYTSGIALQTLGPRCPYIHALSDDPESKCCVRTLADIYAQKTGAIATDHYLNEIKGVAKLSGKDFGEVLREVMSKIEVSLDPMEPSTLFDPLRLEASDSTEKPFRDVDSLQSAGEGSFPTRATLLDTDPKLPLLSLMPEKPQTLRPCDLNPP